MRTSSPKPIPILTFHKVDPAFEWGVTRITPAMFRTVLGFLKQEGYETVSLPHLGRPTAELPPKPIVITFDDSYESIYTHALPIMQDFGFFGTVFVVTGYVGQMNDWDVNMGWIKFRHLSWSQIAHLKEAGFGLGSHTVHHPDLTRLALPVLRMELERSKKTLEDKTGEEIGFISFPFGRYNASVIQACKDVGYRGGCGFWIRRREKKSKETFVLERKAYYLLDRLWNLRAKLGNTSWTLLEDAKLRVVNFCSRGSSLVKPASIHFE